MVNGTLKCNALRAAMPNASAGMRTLLQCDRTLQHTSSSSQLFALPTATPTQSWAAQESDQE